MDVEERKLVNYLPLIDEPIRVSHESSVLKYIPDEDQVDLDDGLQRYNLRKELRKCKRVMAAMHIKVRLIERMLDGENE